LPQDREEIVGKVPLSALALCLALSSAVFPFAAKADPRVLTAPELAGVTAGLVTLAPIQINVNTNAQVALAVPIAIAVCGVCKNPTLVALAEGRAFNINRANLANLAF
jgi:hypothetical protein